MNLSIEIEIKASTWVTTVRGILPDNVILIVKLSLHLIFTVREKVSGKRSSSNCYYVGQVKHNVSPTSPMPSLVITGFFL